MFKFNITGDKLVLKLDDPNRTPNSGSYGYYTAEFTFDSEWDGLIPHLVVIENGKILKQSVGAMPKAKILEMLEAN